MPASARLAYLNAANRPGIRLEEIRDNRRLNPTPTPFTRALAARMDKGYRFASVAGRPAACDVPRIEPSIFGARGVRWEGVCEELNVRLRDGETLRLQVLPPPSPVFAQHTDYTLIIATRPLKQLAQAATDLGNDINHPPLALNGASEIRQASAAFNAMQARIRQYIFQRTQMLAAITHDLQTPLTRMRLRLEKVGDRDLQERLVED
ncbi:MAG: HAMP domain-containing protein, partial [Gammaproteobacteria bacterium]